MTRKLLATSLFLLAGTAQAAEGPTIHPNVKELDCLVGTWRGTGTLQMGPEQVQIELAYKCWQSAGGYGVTCEGYMTGIPGMDRYETRDLWGVDPETGTIHWFTVTNAGETHDHAGQLGNNSWSGEFKGTRGGNEFVEKVNFVFDGPKHMHMTSEVFEGGNPAERIEVQMEKKRGRKIRR